MLVYFGIGAFIIQTYPIEIHRTAGAPSLPRQYTSSADTKKIPIK